MTELAKGCPHLQEYKQSSSLHSYQVIYRYLVKPQLVNSEAKKVKARTCLCNVCNSYSVYLHTCLHCVYFGCHMPENHMINHMKATNHCLSVELVYGCVYCARCKDYVYDSDIDAVCKQIDQQVVYKSQGSRQPSASYISWEPSVEEIKLLRQNPKRRKLEPGSSIG
jgi:ubiquitin carboxyl-terminal hydrolase 22/27/51